MGESLKAMTLLLALMAALAIVETWIPRRASEVPQGPRWRINLALTAIYLALNLVLTLSVIGIAASMDARGVGALRSLHLPTVAQFAIGFVLLDFFAYVVHVLMHKSPLLWRLHRVHHSDRHVDVTTTFRQHPLEGALRFAFTAAPALSLGVSANATAIYRLISGINALFEHANIRVDARVDRWLRWLIVTPDMHKIHHSRRAIETDSNYANIFSMHDRLFGTYTPRADDLRYGLDESAPAAQPHEYRQA
ncbi:MAG TPA: sterol desaturase family protein [Nevskiaceae bacterium]|nr:sterol desaturase family protein [Nevskiaceae bacterium]